MVEPRRLRLRVGGVQLGPGHYLGDHGLHLEQRHMGADAAAPAATERDSLIGRDASVEEALGAELVGVGIDVGIGVDEADRRRHVEARRNPVRQISRGEDG
jgi:hypothetical protein